MDSKEVYAGGRKLANNAPCIMAYMIMLRTTHCLVLVLPNNGVTAESYLLLPWFCDVMVAAMRMYHTGYAVDMRLMICTWKLVKARTAKTSCGNANHRMGSGMWTDCNTAWPFLDVPDDS